MSTLLQSKLAENPEKTAQVSLSVFFEIMQAWHVKKTAQRTLLGNPPESIFYNWANGKFSILSNDTLERISCIIAIYKALNLLFSSREQAHAWPSKANQAFSEQSAIEFMVSGSVIQFHDVRRYLDSQL